MSGILSGPIDPWNYEAWVRAWGRNATVFFDEYLKLPTPPDGVVWLVTRILVDGIKGVELSLVRAAEDYLTTLDRQRSIPETYTIIKRAKEMLQGLTE